MTRRLNWGFSSGGLFGLLAVGLGAYADHVLKAKLSSVAFDAVETALRYQLAHSVVLMALGLTDFVELPMPVRRCLKLAEGLLSAGVLLFCGGIYAGEIVSAGWALHLAPVGGVLLMLGWLAIGIAGVVRTL